MKILFTKKFDEQMIAEKIGSHFSYDIVEVIKIQSQKIKPFDLKDKSLIFTSVNGVRAFFENGFQPNENFADSSYNKIYAVGLKTKQELRKNGFGTFKVMPYASGLSEFLIANANKDRFLHFCGNLSLDVLDRTLPLQNIDYQKVEIYNTEILYPNIDEKYDAIVFFSPSGVRSFVKNNSLEGMMIFSIGTTTEKELKKYTNQVIHTSKNANLEEVFTLIKEHLTII